jgi:hypothetical protein
MFLISDISSSFSSFVRRVVLVTLVEAKGKYDNIIVSKILLYSIATLLKEPAKNVAATYHLSPCKIYSLQRI